MFVYEDKTPYCNYTPKQTFENHVDFLLLSNFNNSHYVLNKDFDRFMTNKKKYHGEKHFCRYCLQCFSSSEILECDTQKLLSS